MVLNRKTVEQKLAQHYAVKGLGNAGLHVKDVDTTSRTVTGFYNTYNYIDSYADVLIPGCAKKTIKENGPSSGATAKIKHALFHDLSKLPGKIKTLDERTVDWKGEKITGIYFETKMSDTTQGNDTLQNYLEDVYDNHSIGFQYLQLEFIERDAKNWGKYLDALINPEDAEKYGFMYIVKEIALFEGSTVAFGANRLTPYMGAKSETNESRKIAIFNRINKLSGFLKNGTQSDDMMHLFKLQQLQLKQMITELTEDLSSKSSTRKVIEPLKKDVKPSTDYNKLINHIQI